VASKAPAVAAGLELPIITMGTIWQRSHGAFIMAEGGTSLESIDQRLLNRIQKNFPIAPKPYEELGKELGISEEEVLVRIQSLKASGLIRRIGGIFDSRSLGYKSTLCAMRVPEERVEEVAAIINQYPGVTHNYLRNHDYNMWFTFIAPSQEVLELHLQNIRECTNIEDLINLPSTRMFKIDVNFNLKEAE